MSKEVKSIEKENVQVVDGKVIITSEEVDNLVQNEDFKITLDEEAGWYNCHIEP